MGWTIQRPNAASVENAKELGVMMGAGTDATASPLTTPSLRWSGLSLTVKTPAACSAALPKRPPARTRCTPTRLAARGSRLTKTNEAHLNPAKSPILVVLTKDYMTVPADQIGSIESLLTMVGGKIVYAAGPYASLEGAH